MEIDKYSWNLKEKMCHSQQLHMTKFNKSKEFSVVIYMN